MHVALVILPNIGKKAGKHLLFYRILNGGDVEFIRILHERMELRNRMAEWFVRLLIERFFSFLHKKHSIMVANVEISSTFASNVKKRLMMPAHLIILYRERFHTATAACERASNYPPVF